MQPQFPLNFPLKFSLQEFTNSNKKFSKFRLASASTIGRIKLHLQQIKKKILILSIHSRVSIMKSPLVAIKIQQPLRSILHKFSATKVPYCICFIRSYILHDAATVFELLMQQIHLISTTINFHLN